MSINRKHGIVVGFSRFDDRTLDSMISDVGLGIPRAGLKRLQEHYHTLKRDPSLDEFYLIEQMIERVDISACPIGELLTDHSVIAHTYADMMAKYRVINPHPAPPTPTVISRVARDYLLRSGRKITQSADLSIAYGKHAEIELLARGVEPCEVGADYALGLTKLRAEHPKPGDLLVLLTRPLGMDEDSYKSLARELLSSDDAVGVRTGRVIGNGGLFDAVRRLFHGAVVDLATLPGIEHPCELSALCDAEHGELLLAVSANEANRLIRASNEKMLSSTIIGNVASDGCLTVRNESLTPVGFSIAYLRTLKRFTPVCYRADDLSYFNIGLNAVMDSINGELEMGVARKDLCLSFNFTLQRSGDDEKMRGNALALILGAYRAQIEYNVPDIQSLITVSDHTDLRVLSLSRFREQK